MNQRYPQSPGTHLNLPAQDPREPAPYTRSDVEVLTAEDERSVGQVLRNSGAVVLCLTAEDVAALAEPADATAAARTFAVC